MKDSMRRGWRSVARCATWCAAAVLLLTAAAWADEVELLSGIRIRGKVVEQTSAHVIVVLAGTADS